ncbi:MAG: Ig-like domain-containing protein [Verrucomicrobia bacterium]|nr:Ig-like domain-containing protein [Verrucomicrobiota bacterium]
MIDNFQWTTGIAGPDTTPPAITTYSPADNATGMALDSNLVATFSEPVAVGTGTVRLYASGNPTPVETFTPTAGNISGAVVTLNPTADLAAGTSYYVQIDAGAFTDLAANHFAGIADTTTWNFATVAADTTPPTVVMLSPANSATGVAVDANLAVTFSEPVLASTGSVNLYAVGNPTAVATFAASSGSVVGNTVTFDPPTNLNGGSAYYVQIEATAFTDTATPANAFAGITDTTTWTFTTAGADTSAPLVTALSPANNATNVALGTSLTITFNEPITVGSGTARIYKADNSLVDTLSPPTDVSFEGNVAYIYPTSVLAVNTSYYVQVDAGMFTDVAGNPMAAITGTTSWTFTTIPPDTTAPQVTEVTPANGTTNVPLSQNLTVSFDEPIAVGTGNILIKKTSDNSTVATLDVTNASQVVISASQASLVPGNLPPNATLYVEIPAGAFTDTSSNPAPAYGGSGVWSFSTVTIPELTLSGPYTQGFTGFSVENPTLPSGWSLGGLVTTFNADPAHVVWGEGFNSGLRGGANLLGFQHTGSTGTLVKTLTLVNSTGAPITDLTISYQGRASRLDLVRFPAYSVSVAGSPVSILDYSTNEGDNITRAASLSGLSIAAGASFTITWTSNKDGQGTGASRQIGFSNVSVSVGASLLPPSVVAVIPNLATLTSSGISTSSSVTYDGGSALTERGFVFAETAVNNAPQIGGTGVTTLPDASAVVGTMNAALSGLASSTQYSVRAYATNAQGTTYSSAQTFTTTAQPPLLVTSYTQPFDAFTGTLPNGWSLVSSGGATAYKGAWTSGISDGGTYGAVSNPGVLGYQHTSGTGTVTTTLTLQNDTGSTISDLWVSYLGRVERLGNSRFPIWSVSVNGTAVPELAYTTEAGEDQTKTHQVTGLSIAPGANVTITWVSDRGLPTGSSRRIGIGEVYVGLSAPTTGYSGWAGTNVGGQTPDLDYDGDGIDNGAEYFMGTAGNAFTTNPGIAANGKITWPMNPDATGVSYKVMTSENLTSWTQATSGVQVVGGNLEFTVPTTTTKLFVRLEVTVN